ncbi:hypothetical protein GCM10009625_36760 [Brachybacterium fresconis]
MGGASVSRDQAGHEGSPRLADAAASDLLTAHGDAAFLATKRQLLRAILNARTQVFDVYWTEMVVGARLRIRVSGDL